MSKKQITKKFHLTSQTVHRQIKDDAVAATVLRMIRAFLRQIFNDSVSDPGLFLPDPDWIFFPSPDPDRQKNPDRNRKIRIQEKTRP